MSATFRNRPVDTGRSRARFLRQRFGEELRVARVAAGLSQSQLARRARVSQTTVSAVERGARGASMEVASRLATGCGYELGVRLFPGDGVSLRDSGQLAMAEALLAAALQWPGEGVPDNPRGWLLQVAARRMTDHLRTELARVASRLGADGVEFVLERPRDAGHGDLDNLAKPRCRRSGSGVDKKRRCAAKELADAARRRRA